MRRVAFADGNIHLQRGRFFKGSYIRMPTVARSDLFNIFG